MRSGIEERTGIGTNGRTLTQGNTLGINREREEHRARKYEDANNVLDAESTGESKEYARRMLTGATENPE